MIYIYKYVQLIMLFLVRMYIKGLKFDLQNKSVRNEGMRKYYYLKENLYQKEQLTNFQTDLV